MIVASLDITNIDIRHRYVDSSLEAHHFAILRDHILKTDVLDPKVIWGGHSKHSIVRAYSH